ncbi:MotA/TolQ/ExbB proton channel family protein [Stagnihabitans tardus]|uniref:MotA/TolQ/ExbB proton channel family protein n=1 Tax=Stagnihabitans tardus TaxID=2699202 RepID=A0AAE4YES9_9RHOB|nr:MotA/TolQ/ExbB proton channel family protein [Stagnihabitans tardus]NBZ88814.1 MotA/TolQ/ExbB proton channel family protein [Stagnihabitans tardus]
MEVLAHIPAAAWPVLILLGSMSALSLALILAKILQLAPVTGGAAAREAAIQRFLKAGPEAVQVAASLPGKAPADRVLAVTMQALAEGLPIQAVEAEATRAGNEEVASMSSWLRLLDLISMVAPLLGLLGTVLGMIKSFQDLSAAQGSANASVLAGGIWEALITTAAGLLVAIPAAVAASLLTARVETAALRIESATGRLIALAQRR